MQVTYRRQNKSKGLNCKRVEVRTVGYTLVLFVMEPHGVHHFLNELGLVKSFALR
jgi:hypothetical protein